MNKKESNRFLEKMVRRYVIASPDNCQFFVELKDPRTGERTQFFTDDIIGATKFTNSLDADWMIQVYRSECDNDIDLIIVPLEITYELINETVDVSDTSDELFVKGFKDLRDVVRDLPPLGKDDAYFLVNEV